MTVVAALAAFALAACGSNSDSGSGTTSGTGGLEGKPLVVGAICSCSGAQSAALGKMKEVSVAWADDVNANGGINGHPVRMIVEDDAGDPTKALRAAKKLIEQDKVIALVGNGTVVDDAFAKYVEGKGVPVVGGISFEQPYLTNPDFFPAGSSLPVVTVGQFLEAKAAGIKKIGVMYCAETPVCAQLEGLSRAAAALAGGIEVTFASITATAPDYTAPCLAMKNQGVDGLFVGHNSSVVLRVTESCAQQDFTPTAVNQGPTVGPDWLGNDVLQGAIIAAPTAMYTDTTLPAVKEFHDALDKHAPDVRSSPQYSFDTIFPWSGGKLFEAAAKAANLGPESTSEDVKRGLYALKNETLGGLVPPVTYTKDKPAFPTCYFTASVADGAFTTPGGSKPKCLSPEQAATLGKLLAG